MSSNRMLYKKMLKRAYVSGLRHPAITGEGLFLHGTSPSMRRGAGIRGFGGSMMMSPHGVHGSGFIEDVGKFGKKALSATKRFFTSKGFRTAVRMGRNFTTPLIKKVLPSIIPLALNTLSSTPQTAFLKPLVPIASSLVEKGTTKGIDALNNLAESKGYGHGNVRGKGTVSDPIKFTPKQRSKGTTNLDKHSLTLLNNMILSAPVKGRGLMPL